MHQLLRWVEPGCGTGLAADSTADAVRRARLARSDRQRTRSHACGYTDPTREGAKPVSWIAPATAKTAEVSSGDHPEWNNSAGGVEPWLRGGQRQRHPAGK